MVIKKSMQQQVDALRNITSQSVDDNTDLEKLKSLLTGTIPRVEKAII